jgi:hypothetical protein
MNLDEEKIYKILNKNKINIDIEFDDETYTLTIFKGSNPISIREKNFFKWLESKYPISIIWDNSLENC